jgi:hypothetical protein
VRVDGKRRGFKHDRHDDVGRFATDSGQRFQFGAFARHFAAVILDQTARRGDDVFRLRAEEAARFDNPLNIALFGSR